MQTTVIKPAKGWQMIDFKELWAYKELVSLLALRSIRVKYAQSVLGIGWAIIQPLITALVFTLVFGKIAKLPSDGLPFVVFSYLGLWPWNYFANMLRDSSTALVANSNLINKVYFPRVVLPLVAIISKSLDFFMAFLVVIVLLITYQIAPSWELIFFPVLLVQLALASVGLGMILSALAVQYRDVQYALSFITTLLMYAAPVIYSTKIIPQQYQFWYSLNPMVGVIEGFRATFTGRPLHWEWIWPGMMVAVVLFVFGLFYFKKMERHFADVA